MRIAPWSVVFSVADEDVIASDVEEGVLSEVGVGAAVVVNVDEVGLCPEWTEAGSLKHLPP